ncbi:MAG: hypothetical protein ABI261_07675, partial [Ginsengibacter sp.]
PMISEIQSDIEKIEAETSDDAFANFNDRTDAIDFIDFHIIDRIEGLLQQFGGNDELIKLRVRANRIKVTLENMDTEMFRKLEAQINNSKDKGFVLRKIIDNFVEECSYDNEQSNTIGYDNLDIFIDRLLSTNAIPEEKKEPEPDMVFYQKTPARIIIELSKKVNHDDFFFDIGSGIGQTVILVNAMRSAKSRGIEFEPSYYNYARELASKFDLDNVEFINEDARKADYSKGTVFFLYTPFIGEMMQDVLALLQKVSLKKVIKIFTYGPCSMKIAEQNWLNCINGKTDNLYKLYEFKSLQSADFPRGL